MGNFIKKQIKGRAMKLPVAILVFALLVVGGGLAYEAVANPDVVVIPANGAEAVSIDTTSDSGFGVWTNLDGPKISEGAISDIAVGLHTMTLPDGWEFNTMQTVVIGMETGGASGLVLGANIVVPTTNTLSFYISVASINSAESLTFDHIQVRPTNQSVGSGDITMTVGTIAGVNETTNFGTLTTVAGVVTQAAFTTQPGDAIYGSNLDPQPVVKTQDQFGNNSTVGLVNSKEVTLVLTGTGVLQGTKTLDIGTGDGNGTVLFADLAVDTAGIEKYLTASADGLVSDVSELFDVAPKEVNITAQTDTKIYDGDVDSDVSPVGDILESGDTWINEGSQAFSQSDVGNNLTLTASGASINDGNGGVNYVISYVVDTTGSITEKGLTVTSATVTSREYDGSTDVVISDATLNGVVSPDSVTLANDTSGTFDNKNVGTEKTITTAMTITGSGDENNYTLTQPALTGDITTRAITVTATANEKVYDDNMTAVASPTITAGNLVADDVGVYAETYDDQNVGAAKTLAPTVISIVDGSSNDMTSNYNVTLTTADLGIIAKKAVNVTAQTDTKVYDGGTTSIVNPVGDTLEGDDTYISVGSQRFNTKDVGIGKTLIASGASITETGNYNINYVTDITGSITEKELAVINAIVTSKIYDGNIDAVISGATLDGIVGGDTVILANDTSGIFDNKNLGTGKTVTTAMTITGSGDENNYTLIQPALTGDITERAISITPAVNTKVYDKNTTVIASPTITAGSLASGDVAVFSATYDDVNVGDTKTLTPSVASIVDGSSADMTGNYNVTLTTADVGEITPKEVDVTAQTDTKTYDGLVDSDENPIVDSLELGDSITTNPTQEFDDKNVGIGKTLTASGLVIDDGNSGDNYDINYVDDITGVISIKSITVTANSQTKGYGEPDVLPFTYMPNPALIGDDKFEGALSRVQGETIGTYEILQNGLTAGSNYDIDYISNYLTITDATAPETTDDVPAGWQTSNVTVTFECSDLEGGNSGCSKVYYTTNGNDPTTLSDFVDVETDWQFTMSTDGEYTIKYRGEDVDGNLEDVKTADNLLQLDKIKPEIVNPTPGDGEVTSDTTPLISVNFSENGSGIDIGSVTMWVNNMDVTTFADISEEGIEYTPISQLYGITTIEVDVDDLAGNLAEQASWQFAVDPTQTTMTISSDKYSTYADGESGIKITVQVLEEGEFVIGEDVNFASTIGDLSNITITDENGRATAILTSTETGSTIVTASYDSPNGIITSQVYVSFYETPKTISVKVNPNNVPADGSAESIIMATISDNGQPIVGGIVNFSTDLGILSSNSATSDINGEATVNLTSTNSGWANIEASYTGSETISDWTYVEFTESDDTDPTATQYPADSSTNVSVDVHPYIDFSEAMDESTLITDNIKLRKCAGTIADCTSENVTDVDIALGLNLDGTVVTIIPNERLDNETHYYFFTGAGVKDLAGNSLSPTWTSTNRADHEFTTIAEDVPITTYDIPLNDGWNLISLPLIPNSTAIEDVLADIINDVNIVWYYEDGEWFNNIDNTLTTMEDGKGYWVFMDDTHTCEDGIQNGNETGVDCGGSCPNECVCVEELLFADNFNDNDVSDWDATYGDWSVVNGELTASNIAYLMAPVAPSGDHRITGRFNIGNTESNKEADIIFRTKSQEGWRKGQYHQIQNRVDTGEIHPIRYDDVKGNLDWQDEIGTIYYPFEENTWYNFELIMHGDQVEYYINGEHIFTITMHDEEEQNWNMFGVKTYPNTASYFDDINVYSYCSEQPQTQHIYTLTVNGTETFEGGTGFPGYTLVENDWNLVGFKSTTEMTAGDYISDFTDHRLNSGSILWDYKDRDGDGYGEYSKFPLHENDNMEPGYGYWLQGSVEK